ncbi:pleckstrin homology domain-containing family G member 3-like isoform X1 [Lates japonicus]|uniref:Pleckstrin homology domain-containing family G member 3-like isoform X1 n=1 Tax=Lates japonicus TaxID=270547 RepID=A0AAD3RMI3_LATJO|nr:pleckstrin homology domain-containing family G member 3-like isoform X1 [Lates japonicus]
MVPLDPDRALGGGLHPVQTGPAAYRENPRVTTRITEHHHRGSTVLHPSKPKTSGVNPGQGSEGHSEGVWGRGCPRQGPSSSGAQLKAEAEGKSPVRFKPGKPNLTLALVSHNKSSSLPLSPWSQIRLSGAHPHLRLGGYTGWSPQFRLGPQSLSPPPVEGLSWPGVQNSAPEYSGRSDPEESLSAESLHPGRCLISRGGTPAAPSTTSSPLMELWRGPTYDLAWPGCQPRDFNQAASQNDSLDSHRLSELKWLSCRAQDPGR